MPSVNMKIELPGERMESCYSPSSVIRKYFEPGESLKVGDFHKRATEALNEASRRVEAKFGFACSAASAQLSEIDGWVAQLGEEDSIRIIALD